MCAISVHFCAVKTFVQNKTVAERHSAAFQNKLFQKPILTVYGLVKGGGFYNISPGTVTKFI